MRLSNLSPILLLSLAACQGGPIDAPYGSSVSWSQTTMTADEGQYCDLTSEPDYTGGSVILNLFVVDPDGLPLARAPITVQSLSVGGIYLLPQEAVKTVDLPAVDADVQSESDVRASCTDDEGNYDNTNEWCAWYWDESNSQYYQFGEDYADAGGYAPTYFIGESDERGLLPVYLFMDCIYGDSTVVADIGVGIDTLTITADSSE